MLSTILYGCRTSLTVAFGVVLVAGTFGMVMGLLAGFYGGLIDAVVMRLADVFYSFSTTLMAILVLGLLKRKGVPVLILAISLTDWVRYARTLRGAVLAIKEEDYIDAARAVGAPAFRLIFRHVSPTRCPPCSWWRRWTSGWSSCSRPP